VVGRTATVAAGTAALSFGKALARFAVFTAKLSGGRNGSGAAVAVTKGGLTTRAAEGSVFSAISRGRTVGKSECCCRSSLGFGRCSYA
jgi:hypothetical protein